VRTHGVVDEYPYEITWILESFPLLKLEDALQRSVKVRRLLLVVLLLLVFVDVLLEGSLHGSGGIETDEDGVFAGFALLDGVRRRRWQMEKGENGGGRRREEGKVVSSTCGRWKETEAIRSDLHSL